MLNRGSETKMQILVVLSLIVTFCFPHMNAKGQDTKTSSKEAKSKLAASAAPPENQTPPSDSNTQFLQSLQKSRELAGEFINVHVSVLAPENVADIFGRRIAHRYIAFQITIRNESRDFQFLVQNIGLDMSYISNKKEWQVSPVDRKDQKRPPYYYLPSSTDLSLIRGVSEKGQNYDPRNFILRLLRGAGTIAGGLSGVTTFGSSFAPSVALFNGPLITAYTDVFRDSTINQLIRLSDSAYQANVIVPRQGSKVMVAFVDQAMFMNSDYKKKFYKDPMRITDDIDFRKAVPYIFGMLITEVLDQPATLTGAFIDNDQKNHFLDPSPKVPAYIIGKNLTGAQLSLENKPDDIDVQMDGSPEVNRMNFFIVSKKPIRNDVTLQLVVRKANEISKINLPLTYDTDAPTLDPITDKVKPADAVTITIKGNHFIKGITAVTVEGPGVEVTPNTTEVQNDNKSLKVTLKITNEGVGKHDVKLNNGTGLTSNKQSLTVEAKQP